MADEMDTSNAGGANASGATDEQDGGVYYERRRSGDGQLLSAIGVLSERMRALEQDNAALRKEIASMSDTIKRLVLVIDGDASTDLAGVRATLRKHESLYELYSQMQFTVRAFAWLVGLIGIGNVVAIVVQILRDVR